MSFLSGQNAGRTPLISSAQNLTASWADLGGEIDARGFNHLAVWITLDINDSQDARIQALGKHTAAGTEEYGLIFGVTRGTGATVTAEYYELNSDADQLVVLDIPLNNVVPYVQLQVQAGTAGTTPGQIDAAYYTLGY